MPSLKASAVELDPERWQPMSQQLQPAQAPQHPPVLPDHLQQSSMMLSSLPAITTNVSTGSITQFYGGRTVPRRQIILPG